MGLLGISKKGKWIIGGVCAFAIVATATTGLAAWVIGQQTGAEASGNVTVATIDNRSVSMALNTSAEGYDVAVNFGPKAGTYNVINPSVSTVTEEDLDVTIKGTVTVSDYRKKVQITATTEYTGDTTNEGLIGTYVTLPAVYTTPEAEALTFAEDNLTKDFTINLKFGWGSAFENQNPCEYFTGDEGKGYAEALECLQNLIKLNNSTFKVTLTTSFVA